MFFHLQDLWEYSAQGWRYRLCTAQKCLAPGPGSGEVGVLEKNLGLPSNYSTPRGNLAAVSPAKGGCLFQKHTKALLG